MVYFDLTVYHGSYFGYVNGVMRRFGYSEDDIEVMWYKDPEEDDYSIGLRMFLSDNDALEMVRIAVERGHVELFVVHDDVHEDGFPEIGYIDVGLPEAGGEEPLENGQNEIAGADEEAVPAAEEVVPNGGDVEDGADGASEVGDNERHDVEGAAENGENDKDGVEADENGENDHVGADVGGAGNGESDQVGPEVVDQVAASVVETAEPPNDSEGETDSDDALYEPSDEDVDSADDIHFTDSEEELDLDDSFFGVEREIAAEYVRDKGKRVVNEDFNGEGEDNDELENGHVVGGDQDGEENNERVVFSVHKPELNRADYVWQVGTVYVSREEFKDAVTSHAVYLKRGIRFDKCDRKRVIVKCQDRCPFRLYCVKMRDKTHGS
ncbi:hypothetical protein PIB30_033970 [Stylosanthes scabra]|uniref:Transposase MuDR plant domain-containing protein n=1 Tax=Stylosanthes scabra TaxID=79078 RepID=A0ABU6RD06_9FABA|nr:hypothetical protein [Stylosanthes scabra]